MTPVEFRRHLHRHPELSFRETESARFIAEADYHASLSSEYPVKYSTGKTSFFTRIEYQKKAVLNKDIIIIKAKK